MLPAAPPAGGVCRVTRTSLVRQRDACVGSLLAGVEAAALGLEVACCGGALGAGVCSVAVGVTPGGPTGRGAVESPYTVPTVAASTTDNVAARATVLAIRRRRAERAMRSYVSGRGGSGST